MNRDNKLNNFNKKYKPDTNSAEAIRGMHDFFVLYSLQLSQFMVDLQCKGWHSSVYSHFVMPPTITTMESGDIAYKFVCKRSALLLSALCKFATC